MTVSVNRIFVFFCVVSFAGCGMGPVDSEEINDSGVVIAPVGESRGSGLKSKRAVTPQSAGVFRPSSGLQPPQVKSAAGPDVLFNNQISSGYYFLIGEGEEWVEDVAIYPGQFSSRAQVNGFEFSYCSEEPDPKRKSGKMTLRFYDETLPSRGPVGRALKEYLIEDFPLGGPKGELRCWTVSVDLTGGVECDIPALGSEGVVAGLGMEFHNPKTGPLVASGDPQADSRIFSTRGGGSDLPGNALGLSGKIYAVADGTRSYVGSEPGPADFLQLRSSSVVSGNQAMWSIVNPRKGMDYSVIFSSTPLDDYLGEGSLLVDPSFALDFSPVPMNGGEVTFALGPDFPDPVFVQAVEHAGELDRSDITALSNGLVHFTSPDLLPQEGPSVAFSSRGLGVKDLPELKTWESWWVLNREPYLNARSVIRGGNGSPYASAETSFLPSKEKIQGFVVPALKGVAISAKSSELIGASLMALAKSGMESASTASMLIANLSHRNSIVAETALLGLGVLNDSANIPSLILLLADSPNGRKLVGRSKVPSRMRSFAAYALGLIGRNSQDIVKIQEVSDALFGAFAAKDNRDASVLHACILSLGVLEKKDLTSLAEDLFSVVVDDTETDALRSHALNSASRLLQGNSSSLSGDMAEYCLELIDTKRAPKLMQQSAVQALGLLATLGADYHDEVVETLVNISKKSKDRHQRSLGMIALGQWGVVTNSLSSERVLIEEALVDRLRKAQTYQKGWAAIGLAVLSAGLNAKGDRVDQKVLDTLHQSFKRGRNSSNKAACALALALSEYRPAIEDIRNSIKKVRDSNYRGFVAVALGIANDEVSVPVLLSQLQDSLSKPMQLSRTALGLSLLGGQEAVDPLLEMLERGSGRKATVATIEASSHALSLTHNKKSLEPLVHILIDDKSKDMARVAAAQALGNLIAHSPFPWNAAFAEDINYTVDLPTLLDKKGQGLLNQK